MIQFSLVHAFPIVYGADSCGQEEIFQKIRRGEIPQQQTTDGENGLCLVLRIDTELFQNGIERDGMSSERETCRTLAPLARSLDSTDAGICRGQKVVMPSSET